MIISFATADFSPKSVCSQCHGITLSNPEPNFKPAAHSPPQLPLTLAGCSRENRMRKLGEISHQSLLLAKETHLGENNLLPCKRDSGSEKQKSGC